MKSAIKLIYNSAIKPDHKARHIEQRRVLMQINGWSEPERDSESWPETHHRQWTKLVRENLAENRPRRKTMRDHAVSWSRSWRLERPWWYPRDQNLISSHPQSSWAYNVYEKSASDWYATTPSREWQCFPINVKQRLFRPLQSSDSWCRRRNLPDCICTTGRPVELHTKARAPPF